MSPSLSGDAPQHLPGDGAALEAAGTLQLPLDVLGLHRAVPEPHTAALQAGISRLTLLQMSMAGVVGGRSMIFRSAIMAAIVIESASSRMTIWMPFSNMRRDPAYSILATQSTPRVRGVQLQQVAVLPVDLPRALDGLVLPVPAKPCSSRCGRMRAST